MTKLTLPPKKLGRGSPVSNDFLFTPNPFAQASIVGIRKQGGGGGFNKMAWKMTLPTKKLGRGSPVYNDFLFTPNPFTQAILVGIR